MTLRKRILNWTDNFESFIDFLVFFVQRLIDKIGGITLLVLISIIEVHRISIGVSLFESDATYQTMYAIAIVLGFFVTTGTVAKYKFYDRMKNGYDEKLIEQGLILKVLRFIWCRIFGLGQVKILKFNIGFQKEVYASKEVDRYVFLENILIIGGAFFSSMGSLIAEIARYESVTHYQALTSIITSSDLPTTVNFIMVFSFTIVILIVGTEIIKDFTTISLQKQHTEKELVVEEEKANDVYLKDFTPTHDEKIYQLVQKYIDVVNEEDYVILVNGQYKIFDGNAGRFVESRNRDWFKGYVTFKKNLETMLRARKT